MSAIIENHNNNNKNIKARKLWCILANTLIKKEKNIKDFKNISIRRVDHFGLIKIIPIIKNNNETLELDSNIEKAISETIELKSNVEEIINEKFQMELNIKENMNKIIEHESNMEETIEISNFINNNNNSIIENEIKTDIIIPKYNEILNEIEETNYDFNENTLKTQKEIIKITNYVNNNNNNNNNNNDDSQLENETMKIKTVLKDKSKTLEEINEITNYINNNNETSKIQKETMKIKTLLKDKSKTLTLENETRKNTLKSIKDWYQYSIQINNNYYNINICYVNNILTANHLIGFNNTGNICIWPSEEVLTYYCLYNYNLFKNKKILELGGGMTSLAGLMILKYLNPLYINLTDGNIICINNIKNIINENKLNNNNKNNLNCSLLIWGNNYFNINDYLKYNIIIAADCLFFDNTRIDFINTINYYLCLDGIALIIAPRRGKTLELFIECARNNNLFVIIKEIYNDIIWKQHCYLKQNNTYYDEDIHYPILLIVYKNESALLQFQY